MCQHCSGSGAERTTEAEQAERLTSFYSQAVRAYQIAAEAEQAERLRAETYARAEQFAAEQAEREYSAYLADFERAEREGNNIYATAILEREIVQESTALEWERLQLHADMALTARAMQFRAERSGAERLRLIHTASVLLGLVSAERILIVRAIRERLRIEAEREQAEEAERERIAAERFEAERPERERMEAERSIARAAEAIQQAERAARRAAEREAMENEAEDLVTCCDCEETIEADDSRTSDNGDCYCDGCYCERFISCHNCDCETAEEDSRTSDNGDCYCDSCYSERFTSCESCDCEVRTNYACNSESGYSYCEECYSENFITCDNCNCEVPRDNSRYCEEDGGDYCEECYSENSRDDARALRFTPAANTFERVGSSRQFGIELECSQAERFIELDEETYFLSRYDGSIPDGKEWVSRVLSGDKGLSAIENFCDLAADHDFEINAKCGFHLHLDMGSMEDHQLHAICAGYKAFEEVWQSFVPSSRRNNTFCNTIHWSVQNLLDATDMNSFARGQGRYQWFNIASYNRHSTFEIRLHTATLCKDKVVNWTIAHTRFADWCAARSVAEVQSATDGKTRPELFALLCEVWQSEDLATFYQQRAAKFGTHYNIPAEVI